ncbi:MAG: HEAT repeat domain-containing protein [Planctomycetaceae bacterium]|nr:HEAT repeat domain-containing protein [Planctomycetaceae bacterium]
MALTRRTKIIAVIGVALCAAAGGWRLFNAGGPAQADLSDARRAIQRKDYDTVVRIVRDRPTSDARSYVRSLGRQLGAQAAPVLTRLLDPTVEPRDEVRAWSATALNTTIPADQPKDLKDPAIQALVNALHHDQAPVVRASAATTLGHTRTWRTMEDLFGAMDDPDAAVRRAAAGAAAKILRIELNYRPDALPEQRKEQIRKLRLWWSNPENSGLVGGYYDGGRFKKVYKKYSR